MIKTYSGLILELKPHQVFVFGSNLNGFHGGGAAGYASFGVSGNQWRRFEYDRKPAGWKGRWNVKGVGEGIQQGSQGSSYALPTVTRPGAKRSFSLAQIGEGVKKFYAFAANNPQLEFLVAYTGSEKRNMNGYYSDELAEAFAKHEIPANVLFEGAFALSVKLK